MSDEKKAQHIEALTAAETPPGCGMPDCHEHAYSKRVHETVRQRAELLAILREAVSSARAGSGPDAAWIKIAAVAIARAEGRQS